METEPDITDPHRTPLPVSQDDDEEVPGLAPAPGAPLSPRTAAMVLEAAGKTDGDMLVKNAKDFAATIRQLKKRWTKPKTGPSKPRTDSKSCSATKKTNPRPATTPPTATAAAAPPPTTNRSTKVCAPSDSRRTPARRRVLHPRRRREPTGAQVRTVRPGS
jgi:hypothetical protein